MHMYIYAHIYTYKYIYIPAASMIQTRLLLRNTFFQNLKHAPINGANVGRVPKTRHALLM